VVDDDDDFFFIQTYLRSVFTPRARGSSWKITQFIIYNIIIDRRKNKEMKQKITRHSINI